MSKQTSQEPKIMTYFMCGGSTKLDKDGLPSSVWVCPAYGSDLMVEYVKVEGKPTR